MISEIRISNFKSFNNIKLELKRFNVLIGANASGKSNLVSIFNFLRDLVKYGLKDAISMHGGNEYIKNLNLEKNNQLKIGFSFNFLEKCNFSIQETIFNEYYFKGVENIDYDLLIDFKDNSYMILNEEINLKFKKIDFNILSDFKLDYKRIISLSRDYDKLVATMKNSKNVMDLEKKISDLSNIKNELDKTINEIEEITYAKTNLFIKRLNNNYLFFLEDKNKKNSIKFPYVRDLEKFKHEFKKFKITNDKCFFESGLIFQIEPFRIIRKFLENISLYDIDPKSAKNISLITGKTELEPDGSNLVIAMKNLSEKTNEKKRFIQLLKDFLPFIEEFGTEKIADRLFLTTLKEKYTQRSIIPAPLISDGTMNISALIYILLFENKPFLVFEEPERNLHPRLVSKLISLMKDISERMQEKQIIITTHNPQILKYTNIENLLLIYRDEDGFSQISIPSQNEQVKDFLKNEIGIDELYIQNLLG